MKAIILAAGYATRLYPLTENFPKPLLEVGGKPILDWLIEDVSSVVDEFIVVSNHKFADQFCSWAEKRTEPPKQPKRIRIIDDGTESNETRLGAVRDIQLAVRCAEESSRNIERTDYLVMAGDNVLDFSLQHFVRFAQEKGTSCVMAHPEERLEALRKTAVITTDDNGRILSYEEKPREPKGHLAVPPFYFYKATDIGRIAEALDDGCNPDAPGSFAAWLSNHIPMHAWIMTGSRHDIGDMKSYEAVRDSYRGPTRCG